MSTSDIKLAAMRYLVRREHATSELKRKILRKFSGCEAAIDAEIKMLAEEGFQSDQRYAEQMVRNGVFRYHGPVRIRAELHQLGISEELINNAMDEEGADWSKLIVELSEKKYGNEPPPREAKDIAKRLRFFNSRGFRSEHINKVVKDDMFEGIYENQS